MNGYQQCMAARQKPASPSGPAVPAGTGSKATRHAEIETKLEIAPEAALPDLSKRRKLAAAGVVGAAEPAPYHLDATYYDTRNLDLLRSRMTLRRRTGGPDAGWHLKLPAAAGARTEVGLPLSAGDDGDVPAEFVNLVGGAARGRTLRPVARIVNDRTVRHLLDADGRTMVEIADDHVSATPLREGTAAPSRWREVEVEIVDGTTEQLATTVELLIAAGAAVVAALGRQRDLLITADRGLRERTESGAHDARSAARRLRAGLTVYAPLFEGQTAPGLRSRLRTIGSALNAARDLE